MDKISISKNVPSILKELIVGNKYPTFTEMLIQELPDFKADIISFQGNENCSCKGKVINAVNERELLKHDILDKIVNWINNNKDIFNYHEFLKKDLQEKMRFQEMMSKMQSPNPYQNQAQNFEIPPTPNVLSIKKSIEEYQNTVISLFRYNRNVQIVGILDSGEEWLLFVR